MKPYKTISVIICYFGRFPWYFDFFLHSCNFNPTVDFFIITDITTYTKPLPQNVKFIHKSLAEVNEIANARLGFKVNMEWAYKLCDFKPAYGYIFSDLVEGYDYWGQSDIDIIFGDIRNFISEDMLSDFDFISIRHDYTTGCFALYRNIPLVNTLFMRSKDYLKVFTENEHHCFDECNFVHDHLVDGQSIFEIPTNIESFTHIVKRADLNGEIKAHFDFILLEGLPGRIVFDDGRLTYMQKFEGILYHLYWLKRIYNPQKLPSKIPDKYYISPKKIYFKKNLIAT